MTVTLPDNNKHFRNELSPTNVTDKLAKAEHGNGSPMTCKCRRGVVGFYGCHFSVNLAF